MKPKAPTQLAGMKQVGTSADGGSIFFTLEAQSGKVFSFACPQEAITEIVETFTLLADDAWKRRGSPNIGNMQKGQKGTAKMRPLTGLSVSAARQGLVLSLQCGPLIHDILLQPDKCIQLSESLPKAYEEWKRLYPPN